jgi:epoxyqueuosine reductase
MRPIRAIDDWATRRGYRVQLAPAAILRAVGERLERLQSNGAFAPGFAEQQLAGLRNPGQQRAPDGGTVLVVAVPRPAWVVRFGTPAGGVDAVVPPTYVEYRRLFEEIRLEIVEILGGRARVDTVRVPLKSLAAAVGLVSYGRNNLAYVPPYGSYVQLVAYLLDIPAGGPLPELHFERLLDRCATCRACLKACPTGAIGENRFLLHADRCYTLASESLQPIPAGLRPPSPDCLIGCLKCQEVCPANRGLLERRPAAVSFAPDETAALVSPGDIPEGCLHDSIGAKFATLALTEDLPVLRRNLRCLIHLTGAAPRGRHHVRKRGRPPARDYRPNQRAARLEPKRRLLATPSGVAPLRSLDGFGPPRKLT